jgi:hypothetical protein
MFHRFLSPEYVELIIADSFFQAQIPVMYHLGVEIGDETMPSANSEPE